MRALWASVVIASLCFVALGDDIGVPARRSAADYPVQQAVKSATLAAAIVSPDQVGRLFSSEIAKKYIVVEVAIYPAPGQSFDVEAVDFLLRVGDRTSHSELPPVSKPWQGSPTPPTRSPQVTTETGVILARETDPYGRTVHTVGTYSGVEVTNGSPAPPPTRSSGPDPYWLDQQLRAKALGHGLTPTPVAGYLYFYHSAKRRKFDTVELQYSNADGSFGMPFPK